MAARITALLDDPSIARTETEAALAEGLRKGLAAAPSEDAPADPPRCVDDDDRVLAIAEDTQRLAGQQLGRPLSSQLALKLARCIAAAPSREG